METVIEEQTEAALAEAAMLIGDENTYRSQLEPLAHLLWWNGERMREEFLSLCGYTSRDRGVIPLNLQRAWRQGAQSVGIAPEDMTEEETTAMTLHIDAELDHLPGFAQWVVDNSRGADGLFTSVLTRLELWVNGYQRAYEAGKLLAAADQKLEWVMSPEKEHCSSCLKLAGRVYRGSMWLKYNLRPQSPDLECGGYRCGCMMVVTDKPITKGRPPLLP
jgi:hypothetical protein